MSPRGSGDPSVTWQRRATSYHWSACYRGGRGGGHGQDPDHQRDDSRRERGGTVCRRRAGEGTAHRLRAAGWRAAAGRRAGHRRRRRDADARARGAAWPRQLPRRRLERGLHAPAARGARPRDHAQRPDHARLWLHERAVGGGRQAAARHRDPERDRRRPYPRPALPRQRPGDHGHGRARRRQRPPSPPPRDADLRLGRRRARRDPQGLPPARPRADGSAEAERVGRHGAAQQPLPARGHDRRRDGGGHGDRPRRRRARLCPCSERGVRQDVRAARPRHHLSRQLRGRGGARPA